MKEPRPGLVHVRTPTYKRPDALARCLKTMQAQGWKNWICTVYDDDPHRAAEAVCRELGDERIEYVHNDPQKFASKNIDKCFTARNLKEADYFCVVEDDNYLLGDFFEDNIAILRREGVDLLLRNQLVEHRSGTSDAGLGSVGILDGLFHEGRYEADTFRLSLMIGIGVSNGGMFWTRSARSDLEIGYPCTATLQEYLRTFAIAEPIYVAMEPLAVWAENAEQTTRNAELASGYLRRELDLKKSIQKLQREVWQAAPEETRCRFLTDTAFAANAVDRAKAISKALPLHPHGQLLGLKERLRLTMRGMAIKTLGRTQPSLHDFIRARKRFDAGGPSA